MPWRERHGDVFGERHGDVVGERHGDVKGAPRRCEGSATRCEGSAPRGDGHGDRFARIGECHGESATEMSSKSAISCM